MNEAKHKFYQLAYHAYVNMSFDPDKAAKRECDFYDAICLEFTKAGKDWAVEKFTRLFIKSLSAQSRCASPIITGPANFPVARMEKHRRWADNAYTAMNDFIEKVRTPPAPRTELDYGIKQAAFEHAGVNILYNTELNRLQLLFPGKPEADTIQKLKKHGFKWSPRNAAWQRQLTPNALRAMTYVFPDMEYKYAIAQACGNAE